MYYSYMRCWLIPNSLADQCCKRISCAQPQACSQHAFSGTDCNQAVYVDYIPSKDANNRPAHHKKYSSH